MAPEDYKSWSNEQLIARVSDLEKQLRGHNDSQFNIAREFRQARIQNAQNRTQRVFDPSRYHTRRIALKVAYLGHRYNGFEWHANNQTPLPTIEEELWKALVKTKLIFKDGSGDVDWEGCDYSKAGRTDKGVSAFGNVIAIRVRSAQPKDIETETANDDVDGDVDGDADLENGHAIGESPLPAALKPWDPVQDELSYPRLLNRVLPPTIRILAWCPSLPAAFSARFSCRQRRYRYFFPQPAFCPLPSSSGHGGSSGRGGSSIVTSRNHGGAPTERDGWLNIPAMQDAARRFEGEHDFRNFCKHNPSQQVSNFERRVELARVERVDEKGGLGLPFLGQPSLIDVNGRERPAMYAFTVWGSAFLWHQVRHMVAILFLIGQGLESPDLVDKLLHVKKLPRRPVYQHADDQPLVLWDCRYPDLEHPEKAGDVLEWIYPDDQLASKARHGIGDGRYGANGINDILWAGWHSKKVDEVLAAQLLDVVASQRSPSPVRRVRSAGRSDDDRKAEEPVSTRIFDGGSSSKNAGVYVPVLERPQTETPEVLNARWLDRKRFGT